MDLDKELDSLNEALEEETVTAPVSQEEVMKEQVLALLASQEGAPDQSQIDNWKRTYGKTAIQVMAFGEENVYIYKHISRSQWKRVKGLIQSLKESENPNQEVIEERLKESVIMSSVLWPEIQQKDLEDIKAGIVDSLYEMILVHSAFLQPQQSMLLTHQL